MGNAPCFQGVSGPLAGGAENSSLRFTLNGKEIEIVNPDPRQLLLEYLRDVAKLTGTKRSCLQGGCGACLVNVERYDFVLRKWTVKPLNACLKPLVSVDGAKITTVEHVGNERKGLHPLQERLAGNHASQCGYCTPGFVMSAYALLREHGAPTRQEAMDAFDGNICRCTGYRNVCNAVETFASDAAEGCKRLAANFPAYDPNDLKIEQGGAPPRLEPKVFRSSTLTWYAPTDIQGVLDIQRKNKKVAYVLGDTAKGIRASSYQTFGGKAEHVIYLGHVKELRLAQEEGEFLVLGSSRRMKELVEAVEARSSKITYAKHLSDAIQTAAQKALRSEAGWAGNLWITRTGFPSDLFTALVAVDARVSYIVSDASVEKTVAVESLMPGQPGAPPPNALLTKLHIPLTHDPNTTFRYYRTSLRKWLAHALVNAAFRASLDPTTKRVKEARIALNVYAMGPVRARKAEAAMEGAELTTETLQRTIAALHEELDASFMSESQYMTVDHKSGKDAFRKSLPDSFVFKFFQELQAAHGIKAWKPAELGCFGVGSAEPLRRGSLVYEEQPGRAGLPQKAAKGLVSGGTKFVDDLPVDALHGYLVYTECATGKLKSLDTSEALKKDGVVDVITAADLPPGSSNSCDFVPGQLTTFLPVGGDVVTTGQQICLVVGTSYRAAKSAASSVKYEIVDKNKGAILDIDAAIAADSKLPELLGCPLTEYSQGDVEAALRDAEMVVEGDTHVIGQHAFPIEKQTCVVWPEDQHQMIVYSSTQASDLCRHTVAGNLGLEERAAHVVVRSNRAGGAFGIKLSRNIPPACAAAIASNKLDRAVRIQLDACQEQAMAGGRHPVKAHFKVGFKKDGTIQACAIESWLQCGCSHDFSGMLVIEYSEALASVYSWGGNMSVRSHTMKTNTPSHSAVRSFGNPQAMFVTETILEHVATSVGKSVEEVREKNMMKASTAFCPWGQPIEHYNADQLWAKLKADCKYDERSKAVDKFNAEHRWRKRGISLVPMIYGHTYVYPSGTGALVNIHGGWLNMGRGAVTVHHGGCEIGQGIHTKVAQVVAMTLGCPLEKVRVADTSTEVVPNMRFTGGSTTSEAACEAARRACVELKERLEPHRKAFLEKEGKDPSWEELCGIANQWVFGNDDNLSATGIFNPKNNKYSKNADGTPGGSYHGDYFTCGAGCTEVELDILTGERRVLRSDVLFDIGHSLNPGVDLGQVEGAFAMGIGYYLTEEPLYDNKGTERSQGTWEYKPPMAAEMPIEFKAELTSDNPYDKGVLGSKAVGEPPFMLSYSVLGAVKKAVSAARKDAGKGSEFGLPMPCTVDAVRMACGVDSSQFAC